MPWKQFSIDADGDRDVLRGDRFNRSAFVRCLIKSQVQSIAVINPAMIFVGLLARHKDVPPLAKASVSP